MSFVTDAVSGLQSVQGLAAAGAKEIYSDAAAGWELVPGPDDIAAAARAMTKPLSDAADTAVILTTVVALITAGVLILVLVVIFKEL